MDTEGMRRAAYTMQEAAHEFSRAATNIGGHVEQLTRLLQDTVGHLNGLVERLEKPLLMLKPNGDVVLPTSLDLELLNVLKRGAMDRVETIEEVNRLQLTKALYISKGNIHNAARLLGITTPTVKAWCEKWSIAPATYEGLPDANTKY